MTVPARRAVAGPHGAPEGRSRPTPEPPAPCLRTRYHSAAGESLRLRPNFRRRLTTRQRDHHRVGQWRWTEASRASFEQPVGQGQAELRSAPNASPSRASSRRRCQLASVALIECAASGLVQRDTSSSRQRDGDARNVFVVARRAFRLVGERPPCRLQARERAGDGFPGLERRRDSGRCGCRHRTGASTQRRRNADVSVSPRVNAQSSAVRPSVSVAFTSAPWSSKKANHLVTGSIGTGGERQRGEYHERRRIADPCPCPRAPASRRAARYAPPGRRWAARS